MQCHCTGLDGEHVVHGEGMAILAGDGLQSEAFRLLASEPQGYHPALMQRKLRVLSLIASCFLPKPDRQTTAEGDVGERMLMAEQTTINARNEPAACKHCDCDRQRLGRRLADPVDQGVRHHRPEPASGCDRHRVRGRER